MSRSALLILLMVFTLSVAVRWPLMDRPLSAHHEYCTAFTLIALTNWWEDGFATHKGMPSGGFIRDGAALFPADRYDRNARAVGLYYFSHPPLAYDLPYALFVLFDTAPNAAGLQWMNIIFHLITTMVFFFALRVVMDERGALFGAVLYLFLPATLWFHGNVYMSDMFVQVPWILHLVFALRLFQDKGPVPRRNWIGYGVTLFLVVYTSWLGVFAAAVGVLVAVLRWWREARSRLVSLVLLTGLALVAAFGLTAWRFLQVIDAGALLDHYAARFAVRGSIGADLWPTLKQVAVNYRIGFLPVIVLLVVLVLRNTRRKAETSAFSGTLGLFALLSGLPVLLDHLVLLQYAEHDFAALKAAPLLCGLAGWQLSQLGSTWSRVALGLTCLAGVLYFYRTNPLPGHDQGRYAQEQTIGSFIATNAAADEVVFGQGISTEPQVVWYARRNVLGVASIEDAERMLRERDLPRGVVISVSNGELVATHITR
ncbi:MAG: hypothetical protein JNN32_02395 [Flavobacteriales bacterium]|nr:hypothetical protein [Flavobacteriales bacterium]